MIITPELIAEAIASAPTWAEIARRAPEQRIREDACRQVAQHVYHALRGSSAADATAQLALPL